MMALQKRLGNWQAGLSVLMNGALANVKIATVRTVLVIPNLATQHPYKRGWMVSAFGSFTREHLPVFVYVTNLSQLCFPHRRNS
jgi:hypothetical protein